MPANGNSLALAADYIRSVFEEAGLFVTRQDYQYYDQRVTNVLGTLPVDTEVSAYYVVALIKTLSPALRVQDDNASAVAVMLELARRLRYERIKAPRFSSVPSRLKSRLPI
jgi:hypothetical protein